MASVEAWNKGIIAYFTAGAAKSSPIFLSLDDEAVEEVAERFLEESVTGDPLGDFILSVRRHCISENGE
jgi:hypothetical protein